MPIAYFFPEVVISSSEGYIAYNLSVFTFLCLTQFILIQ